MFLCGGFRKIKRINVINNIEVAPDTEIGIVNMKHAQYLFLAMLSLLLFSCNEKANTLQPVSSKLSGSLAECFEVVVKDYKIVGNQVNLEFVRIKEGVVEPEITAEFLDENGNVLSTTKADNNSNTHQE